MKKYMILIMLLTLSMFLCCCGEEKTEKKNTKSDKAVEAEADNDDDKKAEVPQSVEATPEIGDTAKAVTPEIDSPVANLNLIYPMDEITLPFTADVVYHPENYPDIALKGTMSEEEIDRIVEGITDMLLHYTDAVESDCVNGECLTQEFYTDENGTIVTKCMVWTGNSVLDEVMGKVGYTEYEVNYVYPYGIWADSEADFVAPVYVSLYIDGKGYEYNFADGQLIKRYGPDGETYNIKTNDFINSIYKFGCYYGNTIEGERNRYQVLLMSMDQVEKTKDSFIFSANVFGRENNYQFIVDKDSKFAPDYNTIGFEGRIGNESFYDWYLRTYEEAQSSEDSTEYMKIIGIFDVKATNGHVDYVYGTYWWD